MTEAWTTYDQIEQLQGKYNLRDRDRKAYYEWAENHIRQNEAVLINLRQENRKKRILLADRINGDVKVINRVFHERREEKLSLQRENAASAILVTDQKVRASSKTLNALRHGRLQREEEIKELKRKLNKLLEFQRKQTPEQAEAEQRIRRLENTLDKADIKLHTAINISDHYEAILCKMRQESMSFPAKLEATERALRDQIQELKELRVMAGEAKEARDKTKGLLSTTEQMVYESRKKRELRLNRTKKEVEQRKEEAEQLQKQTNRATLNFADPLHEQRLAHESQQKADRQSTILNQEQAIERIKEATCLSSPQDFVGRFKSQDSTMSHLVMQQEEYQQLRKQLREGKGKLLQEYNDLRYSDEKRVGKTRQMIEGLALKVEEYNEKREITIEEMSKQGKLLVDVKSGIYTLLDVIKHVRLIPPAKSQLTGDILEDIELTILKLEKINRKTDSRSIENLKVQMKSFEFYEFLESLLPEDNVRINISGSSSSIESFDFEGQDEQNVFTREDIKKQGQQLVDFKVKPKKRRAKKK